jgi:hypothetical protein
MSLADDLDPLTYDIGYWIQGVWDPEYPLEDLGDVCLEVAQKLRAVGIISLLTEANIDNFQHNLIRSAACWETFLSRCRREEGMNQHDVCAGRIDGFLAALAGHDQPRAINLANLAPSEYRPGHEYEADYAYARALHQLVVVGSGESLVPDLLARCTATGDDMSMARAKVVQALLARDQNAFDESFDGLLGKRQDAIQAEKARGQLAGSIVNAERAIFVEGLALLTIAKQRGLDLRPDYPMCPSIARQPTGKPFPGR